MLLPRTSRAILSTPTLTFSPTTPRVPLEIALSFTTSRSLTSSDPITLTLPSFTRGNADNNAGNHISTPTSHLLSPSSTWELTWNEGTVSQSFHDTTITLTPRSGITIPGLSTNTIIIDKSAGIKSNCPPDINTPDHTLSDVTEGSSLIVTPSTTIAGSCYVTDATLTMAPGTALTRTPLDITITFRPAMTLSNGDSITISLPGYTNSDATGVNPLPGPGYGGGDKSPLTYSSSPLLTLTISWFEGTFDASSAGYPESNVLITIDSPSSSIPAGTLQSIRLLPSSYIQTRCSIPKNDTSIVMTVSTSVGGTTTMVITGQSFEQTAAIGNACRRLSNCHGNGQCDPCTELCLCANGFTGVDCRDRICPMGRPWASLPKSATERHYNQGQGGDDGDSDRVECSNAGICNHIIGWCDCFDGFSGRACERRECPKSSLGKVCSDRGRCLSQRLLSVRNDALPLSDPLDFYNSGTRGFLYDEGWDVDYVYGCHCDSSWSVGLGAGERQVPEFFGSACELKHCPSGDDPLTSINETDCSNIVAEGGRGVGKVGNLCHVDCSNRGICDYKTGECKCFEGFGSVACDLML